MKKCIFQIDIPANLEEDDFFKEFAFNIKTDIKREQNTQ